MNDSVFEGCFVGVKPAKSRGFPDFRKGRPKDRGHNDVYSMEQVLREFNKKYMPEPMSGCWLWIGAIAQDNMDDMVRKGRQRFSQGKNWVARRKLSDADVKEIKILMANNAFYKDVAEKFKIHPATIYKIKNGQRWSHI